MLGIFKELSLKKKSRVLIIKCLLFFSCVTKTGHLRTSGGSFFIEPSPQADDEGTGAVRHVIYRVRHPFRYEQPLESASAEASRPVPSQPDTPISGLGRC